jgi:acetyl esterase/lipase
VPLGRRSLLTLAAAGPVAACSREAAGDAVTGPRTSRTISYGDDTSQFGELSLPDGAPHGVVVVIHGGFWKAAYDLSLGRPLAESLVAEGWAAWNLEYRRVGASGPGGGGGTPQTFDDVGAGIDRLADVDGLDLAHVITLGHSAGGHLATWAAGRADPVVPVTGVISQAGVLDLVRAHELGLGGGAVEALLGHPPGPADGAYDPFQQLPLDVPVRCVHGTGDENVPIEISERYVAAASDLGGDASLTAVDGDHFVIIDPGSDAWQGTLGLLDGLVRPV